MRARVGTFRPWNNGFSLITIQYDEQNENEEFQRNRIVALVVVWAANGNLRAQRIWPLW